MSIHICNINRMFVGIHNRIVLQSHHMFQNPEKRILERAPTAPLVDIVMLIAYWKISGFL